jgi:ABC-type branched-subunit amino acid transport system ATPase component
VSARLEVHELVRAFGGVRAVDAATFDVEPGSITGLIGPNGAGKSTLFNCVSGFLRPEAGRVLLDGKRIDRRAPHRIARAGLVRTFQTPRTLTRMTVLENVVLAAPRQGGERLGGARAPAGESARRGPAPRSCSRSCDSTGTQTGSPARSPAASASCLTSSAR